MYSTMLALTTAALLSTGAGRPAAASPAPQAKARTATYYVQWYLYSVDSRGVRRLERSGRDGPYRARAAAESRRTDLLGREYYRNGRRHYYAASVQ